MMSCLEVFRFLHYRTDFSEPNIFFVTNACFLAYLVLIYFPFFFMKQHALKRSTAIQKGCLYELLIMISLYHIFTIYYTIFFTNTLDRKYMNSVCIADFKF